MSISLRTDATSRDLIDRAAEALGKNRSEFMLEVARREATAVLLARRLFLLDEQAFRRFTAARVGHEGVQTDLFEHRYAILPEFGLRVVQQPSGTDIRQALVSGTADRMVGTT